jgi:hypothetical protein
MYIFFISSFQDTFGRKFARDPVLASKNFCSGQPLQHQHQMRRPPAHLGHAHLPPNPAVHPRESSPFQQLSIGAALMTGATSPASPPMTSYDGVKFLTDDDDLVSIL